MSRVTNERLAEIRSYTEQYPSGNHQIAPSLLRDIVVELQERREKDLMTSELVLLKIIRESLRDNRLTEQSFVRVLNKVIGDQ